MKESFEYVLPSNTSSTLYPNNTASHFTIVPDNPLQLQGAWEVGVKSIFYNSNIGDKTEKASVQLDYEKQNTTFAKDIYPVKYKVTANNKWDYGWRKVPSFDMNLITSNSVHDSAAAIANVGKTMNQWNNIICKGSLNAYTVTARDPSLYFTTDLNGFAIRLTSNMANYLGYQWRIFLNNRGRPYLQSYTNRHQKLKPKDFYIMIFDRNVIKRDTRIILKAKGEPMLSPTEFLKRWTERIQKKVNITALFKKHKLVLHVQDQNLAVVFNRCLLDTIRFEESVFGKGKFWANHAYHPIKDGLKPEEDDWIIDIYKDELKSTTTVEKMHFSYELYPRQLTIPKLLSTLNEQLTPFLKKACCTEPLSFTLSDHFVKLELPQYATLKLTPNLVSMLGFDQTTFQEKMLVGSLLPATLDKREQQIFIYLDIVDMMSFGSEKRPMIQHFVHDKDAAHGIVERFFDPIIYQPVTKNMIDSLTIQLIGGHQQVLTIKDSKTIVTLHFRKVTL